MSVTVPKLRGRIRAKLRDVDGKMPGPTVVEVDQAICDAYLALAAELPQPTLVTSSGLTISAGAETFSLPVTVASSGYGTGTVEYAGMVDLRLRSNGLFLGRKTLNELNAFKNGAATAVQGVPQLFALYEDGSQVVQGRCYPAAKAAEVCDIFVSMQVDDLRDWVGTGGTEGLETAAVQLSRLGAAALVDYTAAMLVQKMDAKTLGLRGINPAIANVWMQEADRLLYNDAARRNAIESNGQTQRRVP